MRRSKTALPEFFSSFSHRRRPRPLKLKLNGFTSSLKSEDEGVCVLLCRLIWFSSFGCPQQASASAQAGGADRQTAGAGSSSHCPVTRNSFCCCPDSNSNKTTLEKTSLFLVLNLTQCSLFKSMQFLFMQYREYRSSPWHVLGQIWSADLWRTPEEVLESQGHM